MKLVTRNSKRGAKKAPGKQMHSLTDAMRVMAKSPVLAQARGALEAHRAEHSRYYYACESSPCSQIELLLRCYVESAQEEQDAAHKLARARMAARNADPHAPDDAIEYRASLATNSSPPRDDANHPVNLLESPSDRIFNLKYPGLDFRGGRHRGSLPAIAATYYLRFNETGDPKILLEFLRDYRGEFDCSGWVLSAFGRILLGSPRPGVGEERARIVFRDYWKEIKHPKRILSEPQQFVLVVESQEKKRFSAERHRTHFRLAARWVEDQSDSNSTFAAFRKDHRRPCPCIAEIDFLALKSAIDMTVRWSEARPAIANVLQDYIGILCGIPSRTLRSWRSQKAVIARPRIRRAKLKR